MAAPFSDSQLAALVWQVSTAVQRLERFVAEQQKLAQRRREAGVGPDAAGGRRKPAGSEQPKPMAYTAVN